MKILIEIESIYQKNEKIFGNICFHENQYYFPSKDWNDFLLVILNWWSASVIRILKNESISDEFSFMDGPFTIKVSHLKEGILSLSAVNEKDSILQQFEVSIQDFIDDFLFNLNTVLRRLGELSLDNEEVMLLKSNYKKLQEISKERKSSYDR